MPYFSDDFNRADSAVVGNNWTEELAATFEILGNKLRANVPTSQFPDTQLLRPSGEAWANGTVQVDFKYVTYSVDSAPQIHSRCQGTNLNTFYLCFVNGDVFYLGYCINGAWTEITSQAVSGLNNTTNYRLELKTIGSTISAKFINVDTSTTISSLSATNTNVTGSGRQAISMTNAGAAIDYDNFFATGVPTIATTDTGAGADVVTVTTSSVTKTVTDTGLGTDTPTVRRSFAVTENGIGNDAITVDTGVLTKAVTDAGTGSDAVSVKARIPVAETGAGADTLAKFPNQTIFQDRFDGTLEKWTLDQTGGTVNIQTINYNKQMVLNDTSASAIVSAIAPFIASTDKYNIEADLRCATGAKGTLEVLNSSNAVLFSVLNDGGAGQGTFDTNTDTPSTFTWAANEPKQIVLVVNPSAQTVRAFYTTLDGTNPALWSPASAAKGYTGTPAKIRFITDATATGAVYVDDVVVYEADIFCLGDSNTAGHTPTSYTGSPTWNPNPNAAERTDPDTDQTHNYPYKFGQRFDQPRWVADRGVNADKSADGDARVTDSVIGQSAKSCAVLIGTNDITNSVALATIQANISSIATKLKDASVRVILCSVPPCNSWGSAQNTTRNSLNSWMKSYCLTNQHTFADVYTAVKNPSNPNQIAPSYDCGDGLHFTQSGLQAIADTVYSAYYTFSLYETGAGADSVSLAQNQIRPTDSGAGTESITVRVRIPLSDTGFGVDLLGGKNVALADMGAGTDAVTKTVNSGASLQDIYDLILKTDSDVLTRLAASAYTAPDNAGVAFVEKWILNRLVENPAGTFKLYDDDGSAVLKTWTLDRVLKTRNRAV